MFTWNVLTDKIIKSGKKTKRSSKGIMRAKIIEIESSLNNFWNKKVFWKNLLSLDFSVEVISEKIKNERFGRNIGQNVEIGEEIGAPLIELNRQIDNNDFWSWIYFYTCKKFHLGFSKYSIGDGRQANSC